MDDIIAVKKLEPQPETKEKVRVDAAVPRIYRKDEGEESPSAELIADKVISYFQLDHKDIEIIEYLFDSFLNGKGSVDGLEILQCVEEDKRDALRAYKRLQRLKSLDIIEGSRASDNDDSTGIELLTTRLKITLGFMLILLNESVTETAEELKPYHDNYEYLSDQFERISILMCIKDIGYARERRTDCEPSIANLEKLEKRIAGRIALSSVALPFEDIKNKQKLSRSEELVLLMLLRNEVYCEDNCEIKALLKLVADTSYERLTERCLFEKDSKLVKNKIIEPVRHRVHGPDVDMKLNEKVKCQLLGKKSDKKRTRAIKTNVFFEVIKPGVTFEQVVLHRKTLEAISVGVEKIKGNASRKLIEWGLRGRGLQNSKKEKVSQSVTMLFYGPPGTGKTLAANAISKELNRELISLDCSNILSKWVGESEKNTRKIFDEYREIVRRKKNPPVLLLNEADQFLHRRTEATRSADHMYNQMQNIFLEQMENFEGVLIATTNLAASLDPAFSRRFDHKIEFKRPGVDERLKLWQKHIPNETPLAEDVSLEMLARIYDFSGGQIALVVKNAAVRAALNGDKIRMEDFQVACENEVKGNFDENIRHSVGF